MAAPSQPAAGEGESQWAAVPGAVVAHTAARLRARYLTFWLA